MPPCTKWPWPANRVLFPHRDASWPRLEGDVFDLKRNPQVLQVPSGIQVLKGVPPVQLALQVFAGRSQYADPRAGDGCGFRRATLHIPGRAEIKERRKL